MLFCAVRARAPCRRRGSSIDHHQHAHPHTHALTKKTLHAQRPLQGPAKTGELSTTVATGVALRKGEADPLLKPDAEYPPWLFELLTPEPTVQALAREYEKGGLTTPQMRRLFRYSNKMRIREDNEGRAKK